MASFRTLALLVASHMLATLALGGHPLRLSDPERLDPERFSTTLDNYSLRLRMGTSTGPQVHIERIRVCWDWAQLLRAGNYPAANCVYCLLHAGAHDTRRLIGNDGDVDAVERARNAAKAICYD